jgi:putative ABC transport system ATP-binding protein
VTDAVVRLENLSKRFSKDRPAIFTGVDLTVRAGEYVAVMGESGVGKSTLLNLLAGLDRTDSGRVLLEGVDLATLNDDAVTLLRRRAVGFVFQAFHVLPYLSVEQNVALPLDLLGVGEPQRGERAREMLRAVGIEALARRHARELSGGEIQRVAIARALVHRPRLVLADEPTGNLDTGRPAPAFSSRIQEWRRTPQIASWCSMHTGCAPWRRRGERYRLVQPVADTAPGATS